MNWALVQQKYSQIYGLSLRLNDIDLSLEQIIPNNDKFDDYFKTIVSDTIFEKHKEIDYKIRQILKPNFIKSDESNDKINSPSLPIITIKSTPYYTE